MQTTTQTYDVVIKNYMPMEIIVSEGTHQDFFYVVLDGSVEISQHAKVIRTLSAGDIFGMENYFRKRPYTTTASAIARSRIAAYRSEMIRDILFTHPTLAEQIFTSAMRQLDQTTEQAERNIPLDSPIPIREQVYQDGEVIFAENTMGSLMYRLIESEHGLRVTVQGQEIAMITRPGEFFGEVSTVLNQPRGATVTSLGRSLVQVFSIANIAEDIARYPDLALAIINNLAARLREANKPIAGAFPQTPTNPALRYRP